MKRLGIVALAAVMILALTLPALAIESEFGGYFRTRFWTMQNFTGEDETELQDVTAADLRTRLYYTAIFHENLKFVNKFEMDATYGADEGSRRGTGEKGYGKIGADGANIEIKNSYVDFNVGPVNAKIGTQGAALARGFLFDDDFSGAIIAFKGDNFAIPVIWMKANEGGMGKDANDFDVDYYAIAPSFTIAGKVKINPYFLLAYSDDARKWAPTSAVEELKLWYAGADVDVNFDNFGLWFTGIYQGGDADLVAGGSMDFKAYLVAGGANASFGMVDVRGQAFYATGDDDADSDWERYWVPAGQSYYWSEIMGYGALGDTSYAQGSRNAPNDQIGNIYAGNVGATVKPMDKLAISLDVWAAWLDADVITLNGEEENYLGTEIDLKITYKLVEGLNLDLIGAYMFAGEATTLDSNDDANPYEIGSRLTLSF